MNSYKFNCPNCDQSLEAPLDMIGETISCPACNSSIEISAPVSKGPPPIPSSGKQMKECHFCGEEVLATARKCKHCGEYLDESSRKSDSRQTGMKPSAPEETIWEGHPSGLYYIFSWILGILLLPFFGIGLLLFIYNILDQKTRVYTHTTRKVIERVGIISRRTREVSIRDIKSINMKQGIIERLLGLGTVEIGSAGTGGVEVEFKGIKKPTKVRDGIRKSKNELYP